MFINFNVTGSRSVGARHINLCQILDYLMINRYYASKTLNFHDIPSGEYQKVKQFQNKLTKEYLMSVDEIQLKYNKSSGPGGQNVNKVNTKAELRLDIHKVEWIPKFIIDILKESGKLSKNHELLIITSDRNRTQHANKNDCYEKLYEMLKHASEQIPEPTSKETLEKIDASLKWFKERNLKSKKLHANKKFNRKNLTNSSLF